jgi:hypothetical protein
VVSVISELISLLLLSASLHTRSFFYFFLLSLCMLLQFYFSRPGHEVTQRQEVVLTTSVKQYSRGGDYGATLLYGISELKFKAYFSALCS